MNKLDELQETLDKKYIEYIKETYYNDHVKNVSYEQVLPSLQTVNYESEYIQKLKQ